MRFMLKNHFHFEVLIKKKIWLKKHASGWKKVKNKKVFYPNLFKFSFGPLFSLTFLSFPNIDLNGAVNFKNKDFLGLRFCIKMKNDSGAVCTHKHSDRDEA